MRSRHPEQDNFVADPIKQRVLAKASIAAGQALGLSQSQVARALNWNAADATDIHGGPFKGEAIDLVNLYKALFVLTGGIESHIKRWMSTNCSGLDGVPSDLILQPGGLSFVLQYVEAVASEGNPDAT